MRTVPCNLCGEQHEFAEVFSDASKNLRVVRCKGCGLVFVNPTFTPQEHHQYYNTTYWNEFPTNAAGAYSEIPPGHVEQWHKRAVAHIDYLRTFCEPIKEHKQRMNVLEVGCGYAAHLEEIRKRCPDARLAAVEPNRRMYALIHKRMPDVQILGTTLETLSGRMLFDCILAVDVLERVVDPSTTCRRLQTMFAHNGLGLIITHNAAGRQGHVYDLSHLYYFTEGTLHSLLTRCHIDVVRMDVRGEMGIAGDDRIYAIVRKR